MDTVDHVSLITFDSDNKFIERFDGELHIYNPSSVSDFYSFLFWIVRNDLFILKVQKREYKVRVCCNGWACGAITTDYDGPEDHINLAHGGSAKDALTQLIDQLSEAILEERI